jgi:hypothetical protein
MLKIIGWLVAIIAVMMSGLLRLPGSVMAQDDDAARQVVLDAVQAVVALDGYHVQAKTDSLNHIIYKDGSTFDTLAIQKIEADILKNGDRQFTREIRTGENFETTVSADPLLIEQVTVDGKVYLNFHTEGTTYEDVFTFKPGWWDYDHLIDSLDNNVMSYAVQQYANIYTPLDNAFSDDTILSVEEVQPENRDGLKLRVFDVELDAVKLLLQERTAVGEDSEQLLAQSKDLLAASDITRSYRLWIGADDGLLYRGKGSQRTFIPYSTAGRDSDPDFDLESSGASEFTLSRHSEPVEIAPPDPALLNE